MIPSFVGNSYSQRDTLWSSAVYSLVRHERCLILIILSLEKPDSHRYVDANIVVIAIASFFKEG